MPDADSTIAPADAGADSEREKNIAAARAYFSYPRPQRERPV
jgi:hypothetical protein